MPKSTVDILTHLHFLIFLQKLIFLGFLAVYGKPGSMK